MLEKEAAAPEPPAGAAATSEEDEEAPEEVTFERARAAAETERRRAGDTARRDRELLKEKRRRQEELFKEQKKRKLLPENVLEELTSGPQINNNNLSDTTKQGENRNESENKNEERNTGQDNRGNKRVVRFKGNYMAVCLKDQDLTSQYQKMAKDFVQSHLYGPGTNRTTANQFFSFVNKKSPLKKAAVQFVNKYWGKRILSQNISPIPWVPWYWPFWNPILKEIFPKPPLLVFKPPPPPTSPHQMQAAHTPGHTNSKKHQNKCKTCRHIPTATIISTLFCTHGSLYTGLSKHVVYLIQCTKCLSNNYVGET
ncbi:U3 small nucleolar RNA-associated protein NOL7 isoform X1 [Eretmochelys imbricata]